MPPSSVNAGQMGQRGQRDPTPPAGVAVLRAVITG